MFCDKCGYTMDSFDKECRRCHGLGAVTTATQAVVQPAGPSSGVLFTFTDDPTVDDQRLRFKAKTRKNLNKALSFLGVFLVTQYGLSLYQRHSYEQALLSQYNQEMQKSGNGVSCSSVELKGFGLFGTKEASGYIHCSDGMRRHATWKQDRSEGAQWNVVETGLPE